MTNQFRVQAPTRVDLAGGTLDLWPIYCFLGYGKTINVAIDLMAYADFSIRPNPISEFSLEAFGTEEFTFQKPLLPREIVELPLALQLPVRIVSEYWRKKAILPKQKVAIQIHTQAPMGSGLGGSSALCVMLAKGLARVFCDYQEQGWQWKMLDWVKDVEAAQIEVPTGTQDYLAALFGGLNCFRFELGGIQSKRYPKEVLGELSKRMMVLFSGEMHESGMSNWEVYKKAVEKDHDVRQGLVFINQIVEELDSQLNATKLDWQQIGETLSEEWRIRKEMFRVETSRLEEIISVLKKNQVFGCKVCGAAQGGSILALVDPKRKKALSEVCKNMGIKVLPTQCIAEGVKVLPTQGVAEEVERLTG